MTLNLVLLALKNLQEMVKRVFMVLQFLRAYCQKNEKINRDLNSSCAALQTDENANQLLEQLRGILNKRPILTTGDGNCLFNAVFQCLTGSEVISTKLRYFTAVKLGTNHHKYKDECVRREFCWVAEDFSDACKAATTRGSFSSAWTLMALADVISANIISVYPRMNGPLDRVARILDVTFYSERKKTLLFISCGHRAALNKEVLGYRTTLCL